MLISRRAIVTACFIAIIAVAIPFCVMSCYRERHDTAMASAENTPDQIILPVLMYHNVVQNKRPSKYEVTVDMLRNDFLTLRERGYTPISADTLIAYAKGAKIALPDKPILLSFDDGFYNYNKYLLGLLEEFDYSAVIAVVGEFTRFNKSTSAVSNYIYVDYDDIKALHDSGHVTIANHSNNLHWLKGKYRGIMPYKGEDKQAYKERFREDTNAMNENLSKIGINPMIYVYPYGMFVKESEEVLDELGYIMTLTCEEKVNRVRCGSTADLLRLGRYNRDGSKPNLLPLLNTIEKSAALIK